MPDKKVVQLGRAKTLDPKTMLIDATAQADEYEDVVIVAKHKDGSCIKWSTTKDHWVLSGCAMAISDLAMIALSGGIVDE